MQTKTLIIEGHEMDRPDTFVFTNSRDLKNASHKKECPKDQADGIFIPEQGKDSKGENFGPGWWPKNKIDNWDSL